VSYDRVISEVYAQFERGSVKLDRWPALPFGIKATDKEGQVYFFYLNGETDTVKWLISGKDTGPDKKEGD